LYLVTKVPLRVLEKTNAFRVQSRGVSNHKKQDKTITKLTNCSLHSKTEEIPDVDKDVCFIATQMFN
jgi:hypothetical protein